LPEKATHDYKRNGTTTLFAALEVATGRVTDQCYDRHGKAEFLDFLRRVAKAYPRRELHVVLDNYHTHKHDDIDAWLAKNPRVTLHSTPTSGSWLNLVELFFGIITRQAIRRGFFDSVSNSSARSAPSSRAGTTAATPSPGPRQPTRSCPTPPANEIQTRETRRLCQGCSHPLRHLQEQYCPRSTTPASSMRSLVGCCPRGISRGTSRHRGIGDCRHRLHAV